MESYVKPIVLANEELAEGVYAASGSVVEGSGSASVSGIELTTPGNEYWKVNQYTVTIQNTGNEALVDWSVSVNVTSGTATEVTTYSAHAVNVSLAGSKITITPSSEQGTIAAGGSLAVSVVVTFSSDSITLG